MDSDSETESNSSQIEYLEELNKPLFTVGRELATLVTSCEILDTAWKNIECVCKNNVDYSVNEHEGVAYVTFPSFSREDFGDGGYNIQKESIFSVCLKGTDNKPAIVHKGAFNRFKPIVQSLDFKAKMNALKAKPIIFVGHSMGGAVATLATLFFLQTERQKPYFCITFGSPLVGNAILGEAIGREGWTGKFCHVVSKYDIVPRMLLAPFDSIAKPLKAIVPHWRRIMGADNVAATHLSQPEACKTLLDEVLKCTSTIAGNRQGGSGVISPYRPFGTYIFCSTQGATCIDDSEAVLKMLHFNIQQKPSGHCASDHTGYGQMLEAITNNLLNATPIANPPTDSFEMGIVLELEAMAVGAQNTDAFCALKTARELKNKQDQNSENLNSELSKVQSSLAEVEGYKTRCKEEAGYYDSFKEFLNIRDFHVNECRKKLETFWKKIVKMEENYVLPSDFRCQNKWINAGTAYRRLVEPLDIAEYYHRQKSTEEIKSYLLVRPRHYRVLEKWMEEKEKTRNENGGKERKGKKQRTKFASLTVDSCFWAQLEDAHQALKRRGQGSRQKIEKFEDYILERITEKSISVEVFIQDSSFMRWWGDYSNYLQDQSPESVPESPLFKFMENEEWN